MFSNWKQKMLNYHIFPSIHSLCPLALKVSSAFHCSPLRCFCSLIGVHLWYISLDWAWFRKAHTHTSTWVDCACQSTNQAWVKRMENRGYRGTAHRRANAVPTVWWWQHHAVGMFCSDRKWETSQDRGRDECNNVQEDNLLHRLLELRVGRRVIFQQDNHPDRTAKFLKRWLQDKC